LDLFSSVKAKIIWLIIPVVFLFTFALSFIPPDKLLFRLALAVVFFVGFIFFGNFLVDRTILGPIRQIVSFTAKLANNDLSQSMNIRSNDEFHVLGESYNEMLYSLRSVLQENLNASEQLALAAGDMSVRAKQANQATEAITDTMKQMSKATSEQFENVQLSVLASQQMAETAQQVAAEAQKAANYSSKASQLAKNGENMIIEVHEKIKHLKETVDNSAGVVRRLGTRSLEIGKIVDVMRGISRQTNLLALNAAIEAARAGEHGRGFSVVADEVRALAEQSTKSAIQIVDMINEIQNETKDAVMAMEIGTKVVDEGTRLAISAKDAFSEITNAVTQTVNTIHEIAAASEEQAASSEEMTSTMQSVANISKQNVSGANKTAAATEVQRSNMENLTVSSERLVDMADHLTGMVGRFKVKANFQRCWRIMDCNFINCPSYQNQEEKCWLIPNTICHEGLDNGSVSEKRQMCHQCEVFKINTKIE